MRIQRPFLNELHLVFYHADCGLESHRHWLCPGPLDKDEFNRDSGGFGGRGLCGHQRTLSRAGRRRQWDISLIYV